MNKNRVEEYEAAKKRAAPYQAKAKKILQQISSKDRKIIKTFEADYRTGLKAQLTNDYGRVIQLPREELSVPYWKFDKSEYVGEPDFNTLVTTAHGIRTQTSFSPATMRKETYSVTFKS